MTDAHERITLPPISSFDISPSSKHRSPFQAGPSHRGSHLRGSSSWDGSSSGSNHPHNEYEELPYRCGAFIIGCSIFLTSRFRCPPLSPGSGRFDPLDSSYHDGHMATGQTRSNHSPYSEPSVLQYESIVTGPRPRSSSAALDRGILTVPKVSRPNQKRCISSREPSPDSRTSFSPSVTESPNARSHVQSITVPSSHTPTPASAGAGAITSASGARSSSQMTAFINSMPGDTQDAKAVGATRGRTPPTRKRKASEMLGPGSPGSEDRAVSPEPSESEAKKKYKKKMNVRHYRAQNKDAMTQLRDALPERMRPPERQAKAYVTLNGTL
jgi:hypothetical protein